MGMYINVAADGSPVFTRDTGYRQIYGLLIPKLYPILTGRVGNSSMPAKLVLQCMRPRSCSEKTAGVTANWNAPATNEREPPVRFLGPTAP